MMVSGIIYGFVALIMIGIGISQLKSEMPVGFYTGEKPLSRDEISDAKQWNKKHGIMWIIYGMIIVLSWICGCILGDGIVAVIPLIGGVIIPLGFMIWYHHRLIGKYKVK